MCVKCQSDCEDCRRLKEIHDEDELCQCDNCGHLLPDEDSIWIPSPREPTGFENCFCGSCYQNLSLADKDGKFYLIAFRRCCANCLHMEDLDDEDGFRFICKEGGLTDPIGDPFLVRSKEDCSGFRPLLAHVDEKIIEEDPPSDPPSPREQSPLIWWT